MDTDLAEFLEALVLKGMIFSYVAIAFAGALKWVLDYVRMRRGIRITGYVVVGLLSVFIILKAPGWIVAWMMDGVSAEITFN